MFGILKFKIYFTEIFLILKRKLNEMRTKLKIANFYYIFIPNGKQFSWTQVIE